MSTNHQGLTLELEYRAHLWYRSTSIYPNSLSALIRALMDVQQVESDPNSWWEELQYRLEEELAVIEATEYTHEE